MNKVAILQSNYIPWKGVFDMMNQVDIFIFFDDVDFTKRDWRTRNKIKTFNGDIWLTIPVKKAPRGTKIYEIQISQDTNWQEKHYQTIKQNYGKTKHFKSYHWILEEIYLKKKWENLSNFNIFTTKLLAETLGIKTQFINSRDLKAIGFKDDKLIDICKKVNGDYYLSGPAAKDYIDNEKFKKEGIQLAYIKYDYPEYSQNFENFNHYVTILDVLFNCGEESYKKIFLNKCEVI